MLNPDQDWDDRVNPDLDSDDGSDPDPHALLLKVMLAKRAAKKRYSMNHIVMRKESLACQAG